MINRGKLIARPKLGLTLLTLLILLGVIMLGPRPAGAEPAGEAGGQLPVIKLPQSALQAPLLTSRPIAKLATNPKMDAVLAEAAGQAKVSAQSAEKFIEQVALRLEQGKVQVKVIAAPGELQQASRAVTKAGGTVTYRSDLGPVLQAWIPVTALEKVVEDSAVSYLRRPSYAFEQDIESLDALSEGLAALNGPAWQNAGYRGAGVKVAMIDGGFLGYQSLLGSDLPANLTAKNFVDGEGDNQVDGTIPHGTATAEIVADIVPNAKLYLIKISTDLDLEQAVNYAISQGVDVISTSIGWYNVTPGDGSGYFADLVNRARSNGIIWFTAAGNDRESHWGGQFYDPDFDGFHNFSGVQEVNYFGPGIPGTAYTIYPGFPLAVFVRWDDWASVDQDYTLYVVRYDGSNWQVVGSSSRPQFGSPGQSPTEEVFIMTSGDPAPYGFVIERNDSDRNVNLEIFAPKMLRLDQLVMDRSLPNLADAANVLTVGALDARSPYAHENYSAQGPTNGPGGTSSGGLNKPDLSAYAGVSTESYGPRVFAGTSASAPHAAGAAALVKSAFFSYSPQDIENFLASRAVDMGAPGVDNVFGHGRLHLGDPPDPTAGLFIHSYQPIVLRR